MEQQRAINALEPFLALSKSATSPRAACDLITQAISAPNTYIFAELLQSPTLHSTLTSSPDCTPYLQLLKIFAWGTWADYQQQSSSLPTLTEPQKQKLLLLSLLPLATNNSPLKYETVQRALGLPDTNAVEALIIHAIYSDLLTGRLDPHSAAVHITSIAPLRDLPPGSITGLASTFTNWAARCDNMLSTLQQEIQAIHAAAKAKHDRAARVERVLAERVESEIDRASALKSKGRIGSKDEDDDAMDVDEEGGKRAKGFGFKNLLGR